MAATARNPKDSMKSTWRNSDKKDWSWYHHIISKVDFYRNDPNQPFPIFQKTDPIPHLTEWSCHRWILLHSLWPMVLQQLYFLYFGQNIHPFAAFMLYSTAFRLNAIHETNVFRRIALKHGFLDGDKHGRDDIPDVGVWKVFLSVQLTTGVRAAFTTYLTYNRFTAPSLSWWLPVELGLYAIVLDFFFYVYHRSCHEVGILWKYHRTHHLTKHPSPLLSAYSDSEQEFIEIALVPLATWATLRLMGFPMGFYDWWICHQYIIFAEAFGHSGLRVHSIPPGAASWLLNALNCELQIEDHDLHHRHGWKKSANYGKQTRLWDRIFGTCGERIEAAEENVDFNTKVHMPWY